METLERAEQLKAELDSLRPLDPEAEARVMQKFRLDWNYHSNKLEGNSYSYGETKMLLLFGLTAGGKPIQDYKEISGHDEAINYIIDFIKQKEPLTETFIRHLHKLILVNPYFTEALTANGLPTRKLIKVGEYKTEPNHVLTKTGEIFYFAEPIETPAKMQELIEWFRAKSESTETNALVLAAEFHYRFILVHPFDDGNGRIARLLMNFILMQYGFPPVIIKNEDKENYIAALRQADSGILEPFVDYISENLIRSLEIMIKGAKGENIEEPDDLDKELKVLEKKIRNAGRKIELPRSKEVVLRVFEDSVVPMVKHFLEVSRKFDQFYVDSDFTIFIDSGGVNKPKEDAVEPARMRLQSNHHGAGEISLRYFYRVFNQEGLGEARFESTISISFETTKYIVSSEDRHGPPSGRVPVVFEKLYSEFLSENEIEEIVKLKAKEHREYIEQKYEDWELRT